MAKAKKSKKTKQAKPTTTAPEQENELTLGREVFCRYITQNSDTFGNGTLSYALAFGYSLQGIKEYNKLRGRIIDKTRDVTGYIVTVLVETFVTFLVAHYTLFWNKKKPTNEAVANLLTE